MIQQTFPLGFQWPVVEPFLFCVHHDDVFPAGNGALGVEPKHFAGRDMGQDFALKDGFRMYHGRDVPGFPVHPHRGFETITVVRRGLIDHADSLGAAGRYGEGDVQWMTAGAGVQHSEMFPLLRTDAENHVELFQIWLNLPAKRKMVSPYFKMLWGSQIPVVRGAGTAVTVIAGRFADRDAISPPPDSWAADLQHDVTILLISLDAGAALTLPATQSSAVRILYVFEGDQLDIGGATAKGGNGFVVDQSRNLDIKAVNAPVQILMLQSTPIGEPVYQRGPFVMNTKEEVMKAFSDYQRTEFGGWPWPRPDMVHGGESKRFAKYPDGRVEVP